MSSPDHSTHKRIGPGVLTFFSAVGGREKQTPCYLAPKPNLRTMKPSEITF